jgi:DNA-binding beta-propeller fold protein YncE
MHDERTIAVPRSWLTLLSLLLVAMMACGGGGDAASDAGMAEDMAADPGLMSDLVERPLPNPNPTVVLDWAPLPDGRVWGSTAGIDIGPDGHVWAYDRCGGGLDGGCESNPELDPIFKFDKDTGEVLTSFGAGLFVTPHGFHVDSDGNVWATDFAGNEAGTKGHQVFKFSPDGEVLLRLGEAGVPGSGPGQLNQPCDVITAPNGDIFVSDGHSGQGAGIPPPGSTGRILKFNSEGEFIKEWGEIGWAPGQFRTPHAMEFDSQGRLYVADRGNHRIQVFDQDGNAILDENDRPVIYMNYSRISGLYITDDDTLYAIDSESGVANHPGWKTGVRIGPAGEDRVTGFIPPHAHETRVLQGVAGEGVAVDADGNVYAAEGPGSRPTAGSGITKYLKE